MATNEPHRPIRVCLIEDHKLYHELLVDVLSQHTAEIELISEVLSNAEDAIRYIRQPNIQINIVLLDLRMPYRRTLAKGSLLHGLAVLREINRTLPPHIRVLVMSNFGVKTHDFGFLHAVLCAGIDGYIAKSDEEEQELLATFRRLLRGESYFSASVKPLFRNLDSLTEREAEVFRQMVRGAEDKEIADVLAIKLATVKSHTSSVLSKLCVNRREELYLSEDLEGLTFEECRKR